MMNPTTVPLGNGDVDSLPRPIATTVGSPAPPGDGYNTDGADSVATANSVATACVKTNTSSNASSNASAIVSSNASSNSSARVSSNATTTNINNIIASNPIGLSSNASPNANVSSNATTTATATTTTNNNNGSNPNGLPMFAIFVGFALGAIMIMVIHAFINAIDLIICLSVFGGVAIMMAVALIVRTAKQCNGNTNGSTNSNGSTSNCGPFCILLVSIALGFVIVVGVQNVISDLPDEVYDEVYYKLFNNIPYDGDFTSLYHFAIAMLIFGIFAILMIIVFIMRAVKRCKTNTNANTRNCTHSMDLSIYLVGVALGYGIICGIRATDCSISLLVFGGAVILGVSVWSIIVKCKNKNNNAGTINTNPSTSANDKKYPSDSYSFLALYGPKSNTDFFCFGLMVFLFQSTFLILMILSVVEPNMRTSGEVDNPGSDSGFDFLAGFIPANATPLVRTTQILSILSYMIFPDASLLDVAKAIELFPRFDQRTADDKTRCIAFSCFLRGTQGLLAIIAVFLLVMASSDVIDIILNFTAVNFISKMDEVAFFLAKLGKYGPIYEQAAKDIEQEPLPKCIYRKHKHIRYRYVVVPIAIILFAMLYYIGFSQESNTQWITSTLKVQFEDTAGLKSYDGCYKIDKEPSSSKRHSYIYSNDDTQFGYCKKDRRWVLFESESESDDLFDDDFTLDFRRDKSDIACSARNYELAHSSKTDSFDISESFDESWFSSLGKPLAIFFFEEEAALDENQCVAFLNDGTCNEFYNTAEFKYDDGDCCFATCTQPNCGKGELDNSLFFDTNIVSGDAFPNCIDPDQSLVPVTIRLDQVIDRSENHISSNGDQLQHPILKLDCDGFNVFLINAAESMETKRETVMVNDEANCTFIIEESHNDTDLFWDVKYSVVYPYYNEALDTNQFEIYHGQSHNKTNDGSVSVYGIFSKTFRAVKIGLLTSLTSLDLVFGNSLTGGSIPSEIGFLTELTYLDLSSNSLTGTIPSEIGLLTNLDLLYLWDNDLTGSITCEVAALSATVDYKVAGQDWDGNEYRRILPNSSCE